MVTKVIYCHLCNPVRNMCTWYEKGVSVFHLTWTDPHNYRELIGKLTYSILLQSILTCSFGGLLWTDWIPVVAECNTVKKTEILVITELIGFSKKSKNVGKFSKLFKFDMNIILSSTKSKHFVNYKYVPFKSYILIGKHLECYIVL